MSLTQKLFRLSLLIILAALSAQVSVYAQGGGNDIRSIDFQNFTYRAKCPYEITSIRVRGGVFERKQEMDEVYFKVMQVVYGDLTGDGRDEAIVTSFCSTQGTGRLTEGYVYTMRRGQPVQIASLAQGDRAFGGIVDVRFERGQLLVERYAPEEPGSGACCPKYIDTQAYRLSGRRLVKVGRAQRRAAPQEQGE